MWIQKGANTLGGGNERNSEPNLAQGSNIFKVDRDLDKRNQVLAVSSRVGQIVEGQNPVMSSSKVKEDRQ